MEKGLGDGESRELSTDEKSYALSSGAMYLYFHTPRSRAITMQNDWLTRVSQLVTRGPPGY